MTFLGPVEVLKSRRDNDIRRLAKPARTGIRSAVDSAVRRIVNGGNARLPKADLRDSLSDASSKRLGSWSETEPGRDFLKQKRDIRNAALNELDRKVKARTAELQLEAKEREWSSARLKRELRQELGHLSQSASEYLSANEAVQDQNFVLSQEAEDKDMLLEWVTAGDARVRDSHVGMDGERISPGETFSNGLRYPGDPSGDLAEVINCRCHVKLVRPKK